MHIYTETHTLYNCKGPINEGEGGWDSNSLKKMKKCKLHELFFIYKDLKAGKGINYHSNIL